MSIVALFAVFSEAASVKWLAPCESEPDVQPESNRRIASEALPTHLNEYIDNGDAFLMNNNIPSF
ncbi:hypothetical protein D3C73_1592420 [compost metagenome]